MLVVEFVVSILLLAHMFLSLRYINRYYVARRKSVRRLTYTGIPLMVVWLCLTIITLAFLVFPAGDVYWRELTGWTLLLAVALTVVWKMFAYLLVKSARPRAKQALNHPKYPSVTSQSSTDSN